MLIPCITASAGAHCALLFVLASKVYSLNLNVVKEKSNLCRSCGKTLFNVINIIKELITSQLFLVQRSPTLETQGLFKISLQPHHWKSLLVSHSTVLTAYFGPALGTMWILLHWCPDRVRAFNGTGKTWVFIIRQKAVAQNHQQPRVHA